MKAGEEVSVPSTECTHAKTKQATVRNALIWFSALIKCLKCLLPDYAMSMKEVHRKN